MLDPQAVPDGPARGFSQRPVGSAVLSASMPEDYLLFLSQQEAAHTSRL